MVDYETLSTGYSIYNIIKRYRFMNESTGELFNRYPSNYQTSGQVKDDTGYQFDWSHYHDEFNRGACYLNADCPHGSLCIPVKINTPDGMKFSKKCVQNCQSNMDCPYPESCYGGYCVDNPDDPDTIDATDWSRAKVECGNDSDCIQLSDDSNFSRCLKTTNGSFCPNVPSNNQVPRRSAGAKLLDNVVLENSVYGRLY
jgi:hypothetical protein